MVLYAVWDDSVGFVNDLEYCYSIWEEFCNNLGVHFVYCW